jgi:hypothetical protein
MKNQQARWRSTVRSVPGLALAVLLSLAPASQADDSIEILVGRNPPNVRWENGKLTGYWVELSRLAAQNADVPIKDFQNLPYPRSLQEVAGGSRLCHIRSSRARPIVSPCIAGWRQRGVSSRPCS